MRLVEWELGGYWGMGRWDGRRFQPWSTLDTEAGSDDVGGVTGTQEFQPQAFAL